MEYIKHWDGTQTGLEVYARRLGNFLVENGDKYFSDENNHAVSREDFERFPTIKTDRMHLVDVGELLIVDLEDFPHAGEGSAYFIVKLLGGRTRKTPSGNRKVPFEVMARVCKVREISNLRNGYFLLPVLDK